jgi:hypothetical protein
MDTIDVHAHTPTYPFEGDLTHRDGAGHVPAIVGGIMKLRSILGSSALVAMIVIGVPTVAHAQGPGDCNFPVGFFVSRVAKLPGPVAGPNSGNLASPPAPGQVVLDICHPGSN